MSAHPSRRLDGGRHAGRRFGATAFAATLIVIAAVWAGGAVAPPAHATPLTPGGPSWFWFADGGDAKYDSYDDCARCPDGSLIATGHQNTVYPELAGDIVVRKFTAFGTVSWTTSWDGPSHLRDSAAAVAVDRAGNVVVAGMTNNTVTGHNIAVVKLSPTGAIAWSTVWDGDAHANDEPYDVAVDSRGDVVVSGMTDNVASAVVLKLRHGTGAIAWKQSITNPPGGYADAHALVVDGSRSIYVAGNRSGSGGHQDLFVNKYSPSGKVLWQRRYDSPAHDTDEAEHLSLAPGLAVYAAGQTMTATNDYDTLLVKYDLSGHRKWVRTWDGDAHKDEWSNAVACDGLGNPVLAGSSNSGGSIGDMALLLKYDAAGHLKWDHTWYNEFTDSWARYHGLVVSGSGRVWAAGSTDVGGSMRAVIVTRLTAAGHQQWARFWNPSGKGSDFTAMCSAGSSQLLVVGNVPVAPGNTDAIVGGFAR